MISMLGIILLVATVTSAVMWVVSDDANSSQSRRRALAELTAQQRALELRSWNRGWCDRPKRIPFAEHANGTCYVLGSGIDDEWVQSCMDSDDRIRRWNGARRRGIAVGRRRD